MRIGKGRCFFLLVLVIGTVFGNIVRAENISLSELYPKDRLQAMLLPAKAWHPFARASERQAWNQLAEPVRSRIVEQAEACLDRDIPSLPAAVYLQFRRNGNRSNYQNLWYERREALHSLVLGECVEGKGRFLDAITNHIWAICEESSWTWPAHIGAQDAGVDLPDTTEPIVALFSAETASSLALTYYLLNAELDRVSVQTCQRIAREIDQRILTPYLARDDFGWMAFHARRDGRRPNNWNPWINSNVLAAALLLEEDQGRRVALAHKVLRCLDNWLVPHPSDGSCDEGPSYWGRAGASLFDNLELLYSATNGRFDVYDEAPVKDIGRFIYRAHIADDYFVVVGDCDARIHIDRDLVFRYGQRIRDPHMRALALADLDREALVEEFESIGSLGRGLYALFNLNNLLSASPGAGPLLRDVWLGDKDLQMMSARGRQGTTDGLYVACWAGHNGQSHNHNDVGNFMIYVDGRPFIIDVGRPTYTRQTFSSERYQIWAMQSDFHNCPTINGRMQQAGARYAGRDVHHAFADQSAELRMDIAPSYPAQAGVDRWLRRVRLVRGQQVEVIDSFSLRESTSSVVENLMTPCTVAQVAPGRMVLKDSKTQTRLALTYDHGALLPEVETINLEDAKLAEVWGPRLYRIRLTSRSKSLQQTWRISFSK